MNLSGWGAKGWNRAFPIHPIYNLGVSLAEIRDLPRMLKQTWGFFSSTRHISFSRKPGTVGGFLASVGDGISEAAGDYLNLQFGWVPALQDLNFLLSMQKKLAQKVAWLRRHNGKSIRRNFEMDSNGFSESLDRFIYPYATMKPTLPTELYKGFLFDYQNIPVRKTYNRRIWFRSKWRFYIPELAEDGVLTKALKFNLVGLALDPSIVYKATPWSWLLDWFVSVGAVIQNIYLRLRFQCVAEYAYILCSEDYEYEAPGFTEVNTGKQHFDQNFNVVWPGSLKLSGVSKTYYEFRQREEANPYGFGITFSSLSAYQWSILAALGLTRGGKSFATRT